MKSHAFFAPSLVLLAFVLARPGQAQPSPAPRATDAAREESFVTEKGFASRVFEVKHREASDLAAVLRPLGSGYRGATVSSNRDFKTISVRDFPENIAAIEAALKRLDVAEAPGRMSAAPLGPGGFQCRGGGREVPGRSQGRCRRSQDDPDLQELLAGRQLRAAGPGRFTRNPGRGPDRPRPHEPGQGDGEDNAARVSRQLTLAEPGGAGAEMVRLDGFALTLVGGGRAQLKTDVTLRDDKKVVVGTSTVQDRGLVVVVSARVIR